jgi:hypothetical protein
MPASRSEASTGSTSSFYVAPDDGDGQLAGAEHDGPRAQGIVHGVADRPEPVGLERSDVRLGRAAEERLAGPTRRRRLRCAGAGVRSAGAPGPEAQRAPLARVDARVSLGKVRDADRSPRRIEREPEPEHRVVRHGAAPELEEELGRAQLRLDGGAVLVSGGDGRRLDRADLPAREVDGVEAARAALRRVEHLPGVPGSLVRRIPELRDDLLLRRHARKETLVEEGRRIRPRRRSDLDRLSGDQRRGGEREGQDPGYWSRPKPHARALTFNPDQIPVIP